MSKMFDAIDLSSLKLSPPRTSKASSACKTSYIHGAGGSKLSIQTPLMTLPWDILPKKLDENSNVNAALALSFIGMEENNTECDMYKFMVFMKEFDAKIKSLISDMGGTLGKKSDSKVLEASFRDSIKESSSGDYPPTIQPKIWTTLKEGGTKNSAEDYTMDILVFDLDGKTIDSDNLKKGCPVAAIIEPSYVWCSTLGVGITWCAKQAVIKPFQKEEFGFKLGGKFDELKSESSEPRTKKAKVEREEEEEEESEEGSEEYAETEDF